MPPVWTEWETRDDEGSPTAQSLCRFLDGECRAKATVAGPGVMWGWLASTDRASVFPKKEDEHDMHFFVRVVAILDRALAKEGAPAAWHKVAQELEDEFKKREPLGIRI